MFEEYAKLYDLFNSDKPYKKEVRFAYNWAGRPKTILDIGCGTCSYWKYYPKKTEIIGVEPSNDMIANRDSDSIQYGHVIPKEAHETIPTKDVDCVTALFDVINYISFHSWWKDLPLKKGGHFIFDIWDKDKIDRQGFSSTEKEIGGFRRRIRTPYYDGSEVVLLLSVFNGNRHLFSESHRMYVYSHKDIEKFCGSDFEIEEVKKTRRWQTFYKLVKK